MNKRIRKKKRKMGIINHIMDIKRILNSAGTALGSELIVILRCRKKALECMLKNDTLGVFDALGLVILQEEDDDFVEAISELI